MPLPSGSTILEKLGLVAGEERLLNGQRWYVANAHHSFESGTRVAMYPIGRLGKVRQMGAAEVLALPKAEVSSAAE